MTPANKLSPRQRECLRLIWERQATSKEIAAELGISSNTVTGYVSDAIVQLGARDRRDAARILFGDAPRADGGGESQRVSAASDETAVPASPTGPPPMKRGWPSPLRERNSLSSLQTLIAVVLVAVASLMALTLVIVVGSAAPTLAAPLLRVFDRLTH